MRHTIQIDKAEVAKALVQQVFENLIVIVVAVAVVYAWSKWNV